MNLSTWTTKATTWARKRPTTVLSISAICGVLVLSPLLFPGGWGLQEGKVRTTKTVRSPSTGMTIESTITNTPQKTVWDWLDLLGVPASLALLGIWFQYSQQQRSETAVSAQFETTKSAAQEEALQVYFDRMSSLLVEKNLISIAENREAYMEDGILLESSLSVMRTRTLCILKRFEYDRERKNDVVQFLTYSDVIWRLSLSLSGANLSYTDFRGDRLDGAKFCEANLQGADLSGTYLIGACLVDADLRKANLNGAHLGQADLSGASLEGADLRAAGLDATNLNDVVFDEFTLWPQKERVAKAKNIPALLAKKLELAPSDPSAVITNK